MTKKKIESMNYQELIAHRGAVDAAIAKAEAAEKERVKEAVKKLASQAGFSIQEIFGTKQPTKPKRAPTAKYAHKNNRDITWSGMGRRPHWYMSGDFVEIRPNGAA